MAVSSSHLIPELTTVTLTHSSSAKGGFCPKGRAAQWCMLTRTKAAYEVESTFPSTALSRCNQQTYAPYDESAGRV